MTRPRKILYVSPVAERGGAETVLLTILKCQDRAAFEPSVCFLKSGPLVSEAASLDVTTHVVETTRFRDAGSTLRAIRAIRALVRREGIDLVFGNMSMGHVHGGLAAVGTGAQAVWFQHGILEHPDVIDLLAAVVPARVVFVNSEAARRAQPRLGGGCRLVVNPVGPDLLRFDPAGVPRGRVRRELGLDPDAVLIACIGRLQRTKGQWLFLQASAGMAAACPEAHFVVVGGSLFGLDPGYEEELRHLAARLLPDARAHFLGHRDDLPAILADVDVLVHCPVAPESFGLAIAEAMAMEVPVIASRVGGPEELVVDGETGILVEPSNQVAVQAAILGLVRQPALRRTMGGAGRRRLAEHFSAGATVHRLETALARAVAA